MAVGDDDDMREDSVSSNQSADALSADDVAWVDSCLVKDSDISDGDWTSMKDALLDILDSEADSLNTAAAGAGAGADISTTDIEILPSNVEVETAQSVLITDNDPVSIDEEAENNEDDIQKKKINSLENAFLPGCTDGMLENENIDSGFDLGVGDLDVEASTVDIFRVWDLGIDSEEDELVEQLKKALAESSFNLTPSTSVDSKTSKELNEDILDDLIAGITDLSLTQKSG